MDNGYRAITKEEGAIVKAGDQSRLKSGVSEWRDMSEDAIDTAYTPWVSFNRFEYRRPIAQDDKLNPDNCTISHTLKPVTHYATPTDKIVEQEIKKLYATDVTKPNELLNFIYARLIGQHSEKENYDYMLALRNYIDATSNAPDEWPSETGIPVTGEWDGEGFPPINIEVEMRHKDWNSSWMNEEWVKTTVTAKGIEQFLRRLGDDYASEEAAYISCYLFRPIETQAQAEEREREEVIESILKVLGSLPEISPNLVGFHAKNDRQSAAAIYDWLKSTDKLKDKSDGLLDVDR